MADVIRLRSGPLRSTLAQRAETARRLGATDDAWIIVAVHNEEQRLDDVLHALCGKYAHVVVVDDCSTDHSWEVASRYPVWRLYHPVNCGQGAALQTGIDFALRHGAEILVTFDGDGQHSAEEIETLLEPIRQGQTDVALGSRFLGRAIDMPWNRWLVLKVGVLMTRILSQVRVTDTHNGMRALSRAAAMAIHIKHDRMAHASEIVDQVRLHHLRYCEVPVTIRYTPETLTKGQSSWNGCKILAEFVLGG